MWRIITHNQTMKLLENSFTNDLFSHAYILSGYRHVGKMTLALDIAASLNCISNLESCDSCIQCNRIFDHNHSDIKIIGDHDQNGLNNTVISIESIREIQSESNLKPFEGKYRVYIINGAENLSIEASNALLKLLEEPPEQVVFILLTIDNNLIISTVSSRCKNIELRPIQNSIIDKYLVNHYDISIESASDISRISKGLLGWAIRAYNDPNIIIERDNRLNIIEKLLFADDIYRFDYAKELSEEFSKNKGVVYSEIELWLEFWKDIIYMKSNAHELIVNISRLESLKSISKLISNDIIHSFLKSIQECELNLKKNLNSRLVLESLMLSLPFLKLKKK